MKKLKLIASSLVVVSLLALNPIKAFAAEWRQNNQGWWYSEGNSWATGWKDIGGNWYYFYDTGYMAHDTYIGQYYVDSNGIWVTNPSSSNSQYSVSDINDDWRATYFKWNPNYYTGVKQSYFDNITMAVANGSLSEESAEAKLNALGRWTETDGKTSHKIINAKVKIYETSTNNAQDLINEVYKNQTLTSGNSYDNSYVYYDSSTGQNRVVMVGLDFVNSVITSTTYTN